MIVNLLLNTVVLILGAAFAWLPTITTLPEIVGFDIDGALVSAVGQLKTFMEVVWPLQIMFNGFLVLMSYYIIKTVLRFIFGARAH